MSKTYEGSCANGFIGLVEFDIIPMGSGPDGVLLKQVLRRYDDQIMCHLFQSDKNQTSYHSFLVLNSR